MTFAETLRGAGAHSLAVFGDSITFGLNASTPDKAWPARLATAANIPVLLNHAISGTILQDGAMADGVPRPDNGMGRYRSALLGPERASGIAILYGYNDARYTAAPDTLNATLFHRAYRDLAAALLAGGYPPDAIALGSPPYPSERGFSVGGPGFIGQTRSGFERHVAAVKAVAAEFGLYYAPVYEAMAAHPDGALSSPDVTHPNDDGHRVIAEAFATAQR